MDIISINLHNHNKHCYRNEIISFDSGLFDDCIDMAYLITMENSKRKDAYMKQLSEHKPSSKVTVILNKGFRSKQCNKKLKKQNSAYDITDALRNVFVNALENKYKRILVCEDDFFMDRTKYTKKDIERVVKFCNKKNPHVYNLGPLLHLSWPTLSYHIRAIISTASHAVIYNSSYMKDFITWSSLGKILHCDSFWQKSVYSKYGYYKPLCFQLCPETENMKQWGKGWQTSNRWLQNWNLHNSYENYQNHHKFSWSFPWISLTILILVIIMIIMICKVYKKYKQSEN